ncbi:MAG: DNA repair protein RadC [Lentisphaeria bacterium]|nr:DNA repair protein RadC [Lentisphaeria bacterium]
MKSLREGHRERLRSRYLQSGENGLPDYDMLELLLTYAIQRRDVKPVARELLEQFHDLQGVLDADLDKLCQVKGLGKNSALLITLIRSFCTRYLETRTNNRDVLDSPAAVRDYARMRLSAYTEEAMLLIFLNVRNHIINTEIVSKGSVDTVVIFPKIIIQEALKNKAASLILVHNHPSGITKPSKEDVDFTMKVRRLLAPLEIGLLDHLVVSQYDSFSFVEHGILT